MTHTEALRLDAQAYTLMRRLSVLATGMRCLHSPHAERLQALADRAYRRWKRRLAIVQQLGVSARAMQALNTGDRVIWREHTLTIVDWLCVKEPTFALDGTKIWAEPLFTNEYGRSVEISSAFWHELTLSE